MSSGDRCEFELLDYCIAPAGFRCQYAIPHRPGDICEKCGVPDEVLETWEDASPREAERGPRRVPLEEES